MKRIILLLTFLLMFLGTSYAQDYVILYDTEIQVTIQDKQDQITFAWEQELSPGLIGWRLYQSETSGQYTSHLAAIPFGTEQAQYTYDLTIEANYGDSVTYYYVLTAVNQDGVESGYSNEVVYSADFVYPPPANPSSLLIVR